MAERAWGHLRGIGNRERRGGDPSCTLGAGDGARRGKGRGRGRVRFCCCLTGVIPLGQARLKAKLAASLDG